MRGRQAALASAAAVTRRENWHDRRVCFITDWRAESYTSYTAPVTWVLPLPHGRPHIGANVDSWPRSWKKMDEKLTSENMQKEQFSVFMLYFESNQGRQV